MKTFKKSLSLILSLLMIVSCIGAAAPAAFAEDCQHEFVDYVVAPTCVQGYTMHTCSLCGYSYKDSYTEPVEAHDYSITYEVVAPTCTSRGYTVMECSKCHQREIDQSSYVDMLPHTFTNITYTCYDEANQYYTQTKICDVCNQTFTSGPFVPVFLYKTVKNGNAYQNVLFDTVYAPLNGSALYDGTPTLTSEEDDTYAEWTFSGWDREGGLDNITGPTSVLAKFTGVDKYYEVIFYDFYGKKLSSQTILYHHAAEEPNVIESFVDNHATYTFTGWSKDFSSITANTYINPVYSVEKEKVNVYFYDYNNELIGEPVLCDYGTPIAFIAPNADTMERAADESYVYEFSGIWKDGAGAIWKNANGTLSLYPYYYTQAIKYDVTIRILNYGNSGSPNATYQVLNASNNNYVAGGTTNEAGQATVQLANGSYIIKASSEDRLMAGESRFTISTNGFSNIVYVDLVDNDQYYDDGRIQCSCICHSIVGPIWIKILNVMYTLFNIKYVCCNDMYATHANDLKYTAS